MASRRATQQYAPLPSISTLQPDTNNFNGPDHDDARAVELSTIDITQGAGDDSESFRPINSRLSPLELTSAKSSKASPAPSTYSPPDPRKTGVGLDKIGNYAQHLHLVITTQLRDSRFHGWRMGVLVGSCLSAFVLCCNIGLVVTGSQINGGYQGGMAILRIGTTSEMSRLSTVAHLLINACSTILLGASNYTMQVLSAPTREDIDRAHHKDRWFDIGLLSIRNLRAIPRRRTAICLVLAISSIPLHLFYNAAVFQVSAYNEYRIAAVDVTSQEWLSFNTSTDLYRNLSNAQWRDIYSARYVSEHGDLILAIDQVAYNMTQDATQHTPASSLLYMENSFVQDRLLELTSESWDWIKYDKLLSYATRGANRTSTRSSPVSAHVAHAFSMKVQPKSRLQLSLVYVLVVISFNGLKLGVMAWTLVSDKSTYTVTLGDAAASFLKHSDQTTTNQCILGKAEMLYKLGFSPYHNLLDEELETSLLRVQGTWLPQRRRYFSAVGRDRQIFYAFLLIMLASGSILIPLMNPSGGAPFDHIKAWGTSSRIVVLTGMGPLVDSLLVNLPQFALSFCYITLNGICTSMASAQEWNNLAAYRKGLRVTTPQESQRSTYFLQLPYKWALPLMATSSILHWLMSQSFYLVRAEMYDGDGEISRSDNLSGCGLSFLSLWIFTIVALVLVCAVGLVGDRRMQQKIPLAASCSLVISAACHIPRGEQDVHLKKVKWGVVEKSPGSGYTHCSIAAKEVRKPIIGQIYR